MRDRVPYRTAGAAQRQATAHALRSGITTLQWRVLAVVFDLTTSYSKLEDRTSARQIAARVYGVDAEKVMGSERKRVSYALKRLADLGIIVYGAPRGGRYAGFIVGIPADANVSHTEDVGASGDSPTSHDRDSNVPKMVPNVPQKRDNT